MNHTFTMKLGDSHIEVSGIAWEGEPATMVCPHSEPEFEVTTVEINGDDFPLEYLSDSALIKIERAALESMKR